jgi:Ca-activated chloride channel homolog
VNVYYRLPNDSTQRSALYNCAYTTTPFNKLPNCYRFASSVAMFAALLKESKYARNFTWSDISRLASDSRNANDAVQQEFILMIDKARKIYGRYKKRKS